VQVINDTGLLLLKSSEGCELHAYQDAVGVWTIGYGHTGSDVHPGQTITQADADTLLEADLKCFEVAVNNLVSHDLTSNQFAALVDFAYNEGAGALAGSTLLRLLNAGDVAGAADQFAAWDEAGGEVLPGLVARRAKEKELFLTP
jgi:lysozyme